MTNNLPTGFSYLGAHYSGLARRLTRLPIGDFPTPLQRLGDETPALWVKRDDLTHPVYGGNKIRKLEYLLGKARQRNSTEIVTFGGVGSNHVLATAIHAGAAHAQSTGLVMPQRMTDYVKGTLQRHQQIDSRLLASPAARKARLALMRQLRDDADGKLTVVPLGGTSARGSIGYVNAAFELAAQWRQPEPPQRVYVAAGTMGTAAGLAVGFRLLGWPTRVVAVRVTAAVQCNEPAMDKLCRKIGKVLHDADRRVRRISDGASLVDLRTEYLGEDYADTTEASQGAVDTAMARWRLPLETTYTGKAMACMLDDMASDDDRGNWIFWHTYNGRAVPAPSQLAPAYSDFLSFCR